MHVRNAATSGLIDAATVALNPCKMAQVLFTLDRYDSDVAGILAVRIRAHFEHDLFPRGLFEKAVDVIRSVQVAAVHRQNVISRLDVNARLSEWSFVARIPILAIKYFRNAISPIFQTVIRAEKSDFQFLRLWSFTAAHEHVTDRHLSQTLLEQVRELVAGGDAIQIRRILFLDLLQIETVIVRVIEEVTLNAPRLVVNLLPHRARLDINLPAVKLQRTETWFWRPRAAGAVVWRGRRPGIALAIKNFLAIE